MKYHTLAYAFGACLLGAPALAQPIQYKAEPFILIAVPLTPVLAERCPDGTPPTVITNEVCQEPVEGACTAYWCHDSVTNKSFLLQRRFGLPNPECRQSDTQTEPCSNDVTLGEKFLPSREYLVKAFPMLYPKEYLTVPFLPLDK